MSSKKHILIELSERYLLFCVLFCVYRLVTYGRENPKTFMHFAVTVLVPEKQDSLQINLLIYDDTFISWCMWFLPGWNMQPSSWHEGWMNDLFWLVWKWWYSPQISAHLNTYGDFGLVCSTMLSIMTIIKTTTEGYMFLIMFHYSRTSTETCRIYAKAQFSILKEKHVMFVCPLICHLSVYCENKIWKPDIYSSLHDVDKPKPQNSRLTADIFSVVFWRIV